MKYIKILLIIGFIGFNSAANDKRVKNVIILIPDGMSITHTTIARWYNGGHALTLDELACALVRTYPSDGIISDSAPAATAMATGQKTHSGFISILPDISNMPDYKGKNFSEQFSRKPVPTLLEAAKLNGLSTGLVATANIQHATPGAFSSHHFNRRAYQDIGEQQAYQDIDVILAGGSEHLKKNNRLDREDLIEIIKEKGYDYITKRDELLKIKSKKLWGMFAEDVMDHDMDRDDNQPALYEMTQKAIEILSKNDKGFFLMVEGSKIDWASHANDPVGVISDILAFDKAVKVALDFAKEDGNTAIIAVADHGNGGMSIGNSETNKGYDTLPLSELINPLKKATLTGEGVYKKLNKDRSNLKDVVLKYYGVGNLSDDEFKKLKIAKPDKFNYTIGPMISRRSKIGWTTNGHTGEEVVLYIYHPKNYRPTGVIQNTDIAIYIDEILSLNTFKLNNILFTDVTDEFSNSDFKISINNTDIYNPILIIQKGNKNFQFPINKNIVYIDGKIKTFRGLTIFNGKKWFLPEEAVKMIK
jgi:alkaline phosphatase